MTQTHSQKTLRSLVQNLEANFPAKSVSEDHLWYTLRGALNPDLLVSNLAEALRISATETKEVLEKNGFGDLAAYSSPTTNGTASHESSSPFQIRPRMEEPEFISRFLRCQSSVPLDETIDVPAGIATRLTSLTKAVSETITNDAFASLYRRNVTDYFRNFMAGDAPKIGDYVRKHFGEAGPKYLLNSGIGANEQFNHLAAHLNNADKGRRLEWLVVNSPSKLHNLPADATIENTLFMEFSRSGKTEETVKIHEYTPRSAKRIVFANQGSLRQLGMRDNNLVLDLPDQVSGRFGRNKTPILLAPMMVAGMDVKRFWETIAKSIDCFDLSSPSSLPAVIARFIYIFQHANQVNHIYFGCNDELLHHSADELVQYWNEGVNKNSNDLTMSRYFGLLRDSHANIEALLANHRSKMVLFLFADRTESAPLPPMTRRDIDAINPRHAHLRFGDEERILAEANFLRFSEVMPALKLQVRGPLSLDHAAVLGQLWADVTFYYSRLMNIDPGSNPEVKHVRDRAETLLAADSRTVQ